MDYDSGWTFVVEQTCDLEHWVVQAKCPDDIDYVDITDPFDSKEEAIEWAKKIKNNHHIFVEDDF